MDYIVFKEECDPKTLSRMGGGASLPSNLDWPKDESGRPMLHLMTLSSDLINVYSGCTIPKTHCVSVFMPFAKNSIQHVIDMARRPDATRILLHEVAAEIRQECADALEPPHAITIDSDPSRDDEDEFSDEIEPKIGGRATWLQDVINVPGKRFLLQLLGYEFNESWPSHQGMFMGGVIYLFLNKNCGTTTGQFGQLTVQYT